MSQQQKSQQEPAFYNLEFFGDAAFWEGTEDASRRAFLMPLPSPAEFLAFGVVGPTSTVHFVARGRVHEHLGEFVAAMTRDGATVELYARPPLPWPLVKRYISDEPYENTETEGPKPPPVNGFMGYGGGGEVELWKSQVSLAITDDVKWPTTDITSRMLIIMRPLKDTNDFMAFGVYTDRPRFVFAARGTIGEQLDSFIARMTPAVSSVETVDVPPEGFLRTYLEKHAPELLPYPVPPLVGGTVRVSSSTGAAASL
jgi:hypothetical protein